MTKSEFLPFSAVLAGIKEIKAVMADAERLRRLGRRTILFIDEIHRFNKAQQDAFLPYVERGDIILIGATTENPSFEVNAALLSRSKVYMLRALTTEEIVVLLRRALPVVGRRRRRNAGEDRGGFERRRAVGLQHARSGGGGEPGGGAFTEQALTDALGRKVLLYDKTGEEHYNLISALHKSVRSSDPDAALYWLARMLESGEDRMYIARRVVRMAIEDIGLADPRAWSSAWPCSSACIFSGCRRAIWRSRRR
jgi:putative ATPase